MIVKFKRGPIAGNSFNVKIKKEIKVPMVESVKKRAEIEAVYKRTDSKTYTFKDYRLIDR